MGDQHLYKIDTTVQDSDKSWTVPAHNEWHVDAVYVKLATTATVGNRRIEVAIADTASNVVTYGVADTVLAASSTGYHFFSPEMPLDAGFTAERIRAPLFDGWLRPGFTLRVYDNAAVAADSDVMTVALFITERDVLS
jgi:hypothetical protein